MRGAAVERKCGGIIKNLAPSSAACWIKRFLPQRSTAQQWSSTGAARAPGRRQSRRRGRTPPRRPAARQLYQGAPAACVGSSMLVTSSTAPGRALHDIVLGP